LGVPNNLPAELSSFVGRRDDLTRAERLLPGSRLVTFSGAGGCGKTRLARQLAARVGDRFRDGVWWVELAPLTDPDLVADRVCRTVGLVWTQEIPASLALAEFLRDSTCLLILDNCEHLLDAVAFLVDPLLRGTAGVQVLVTSREPIGVEGETTWRVPSLQVPEADPGADLDSLAALDAVALFVERAGQAGASLALTEHTAADVTRICRHLDGIPLALELAAARVASVPLDRIVSGLDDRFSMLVGGPRAGLARHQTLAASVDWSYQLLEPAEQVLFRRLGVFVGGFTAEAVETITGCDLLAREQALPALARLVSKSLVQLESIAGMSARYRLLETIREYALVRLAESGEASRIRGRQLSWAADLAAALEPGSTQAQAPALDALEAELPNLRAALDHASTAPDSAAASEGLRLAAVMAFFWAQRGFAMEGADRAARLVAAYPQAPGGLLARAAWAGAYDRFYAFDFDRCVPEAQNALKLAEAVGDHGTQGRCWHVLAAATVMVDPAASRPLFTRALELAQAADDHWCEADSMQFLGWGRLIQHHPVEVGDWLDRSAAMADAAGNAFQQGWHRLALGNLHEAAGRLEAAEGELLAGIELGRRLGDPAVELWGCCSLAVVTLLRGRPARLSELAAAMDRPGHPLGSVGDTVIAAFRRIADHADGEDAAAAMVSASEQLLLGNDPPDGVRLLLLAAARLLAAGNEEGAAAIVERCRLACSGLGSALVGACDVLAARSDRRHGEHVRAERLAHQGLTQLVEAGMWVDVPDALAVLGGLAEDTGNAAEGARLLAAADAHRRDAGLSDPFTADSAKDAATASAALGPNAGRVRDEGANLTPTEAVAYARRTRGQRRRPSFGWDSLTPTELAVVRLVAAGLSNPAIGELLFTSRGTVKTHLVHIFAKLSVNSRSELAAAAARRGVG
jgi:predicted ATPase/DNA-binding CsgD family transcriptional regulator